EREAAGFIESFECSHESNGAGTHQFIEVHTDGEGTRHLPRDMVHQAEVLFEQPGAGAFTAGAVKLPERCVHDGRSLRREKLGHDQNSEREVVTGVTAASIRVTTSCAGNNTGEPATASQKGMPALSAAFSDASNGTAPARCSDEPRNFCAPASSASKQRCASLSCRRLTSTSSDIPACRCNAALQSAYVAANATGSLAPLTANSRSPPCGAMAALSASSREPQSMTTKSTLAPSASSRRMHAR